MEVGIKHTVTEIVTKEKTAAQVGSGLLPVLSQLDGPRISCMF